MRVEKLVSFAIVVILLGLVMWRGSATGFVTAVLPPPEPGCIDKDLGFSPSVASSAVSEGIELRDQCYSKNGLFEAVCSGGRAEYIFVDCGRTVSAGSSCVQEGRNAKCG